MKKIFIIFIFVFSWIADSPAAENFQNRGHLLLVGGKDKPAAALEKFIELCDNGPILVIPSASGIPLESGPEAAELFRAHGARQVEWLFIAGSGSANAPEVVQKIKQARGIFFTGGVQSRLMQRLGGTRTAEAILELYFKKGGVIGGTSAGAAVQSQLMITGEGDFTVLEKENIVLSPGLGFLKNSIIDQHFVALQRNNRLLSVVIENGLPGIGIDESTAIIYFPDDTFEVYGSGSVLVYDPRSARILNSEKSKRLSVENLRLHVLRAGQKFDLTQAKIIP